MPTLHAVRGRIRSAIADGDYERAQTLAEGVLRHYPEDHETVGLLGQLHLECGRWDEAERLFRFLLRVDPESTLARSGLALIAEGRGDLPEALGHFTLALEIHPGNHQLVGEVRRLRAQAKGPRLADPRCSKHAIARRLLRDGMAGEAVPLFEAALENALDPAAVALGLAQALWMAARRREAGEVAGEILTANPLCLKALALRAGAAAAEGESAPSPLLEKAWRLDPGNGVIGRIFESVGLTLPSAGLLVEVPEEVESHPEGAEPEPDARAGSVDEAETLELPRAEVDGEWVRDRGARGSEEASEGAAQQPGEDASMHLVSGRSLLSRHCYDLAAAEFRKALKADPGVASEVRIAALGMAEESPGDLRLRWLAGDALAVEGQLRLAMEQYLKALEGQAETTAS